MRRIVLIALTIAFCALIAIGGLILGLWSLTALPM